MSTKISALPAASSVVTTDQVPIINGTPTTQRATISMFASTIVPTRITALDANHIHAWELTDTSGNFVDTGSSSSKVNLTATATPLYAQVGMMGSTANFGRTAAGANVSSYANVAATSFTDLPTGAVTMELWYQPEKDTIGGLMGFDQAGSANYMVDSATAGVLSYTVRANSFENGSSQTGKHYCTPGVWHHVALVYDSANIYLYLDGQVIASDTTTGSVLWTNGSTPKLWIANEAGSAGQFVGRLARFRISNIARSQSYLQTVYSTGMRL